MQMNYRSGKNNEMEDLKPLNDVMNKHKTVKEKVDKFVRRELDQQENLFERKLKERRYRSISKAKSRKTLLEDEELQQDLIQKLKHDGKETIQNPFEM